MNYRRNNSVKKYVISIGLFAVIVFASVFWGDTIMRVLSGGLHRAALPFWKGGVTTEQLSGSFFALLQSKQALVEKNQKLEEQIREQEAQKAILKNIRNENDKLKELLDRSSGRDAVGAVILARPPQSPYDTLVIDVGAQKEIQTGDRVYAHGDIPIGEVVSVKRRSSIVELFSTQGRITEVSIGSDSVSGSAEGRGGQNFLIRLPRDVAIHTGDVISAPDIGVSVLGTVGHVEKDENSPFQRIYFTSPVHVQNLSWVTVSRSARIDSSVQ